MSTQKLSIIIREEVRGENAKYFWIGIASLVLGFYFWWHWYFSKAAFAVGYEAASGSETKNADGVGSISIVGMSLDTVILIGWSVANSLIWFHRIAYAVFLRIIAMGSAGIKTSKGRDVTVAELSNHMMDRIKKLEAKTASLPDPLPPEPPKSESQLVLEQVALINKEIAALKAASPATRTTRAKS